MVKKIGMVLSGVVMVLLMIITTPSHATAKLLPTSQENPTKTMVDSFGRETPRGAVQGLLRAIAAEDYELAANYMDGRYLAKTQTPNREIVEHLVVALDAGGKLYPDLQISHASEGDLSDNLPSDIDKVGELHLMNEHIDILLNRRVTDDDMVF